MEARIFVVARRAAILGALAVALGGCSSEPPQCWGNALSELRVCAAGATVPGIDVSYYQGTIDWTAVKGAGMVFAIARVSDGTGTLDTQFARNWREMKAKGLIRGVYQFFRPGQDPIAQANLLLQKVRDAGGFVDGDLPAVLDIETADGQSPALIQSRAKTWLQHIEQATGQRPLVYTAAFMSSNLGTALAAYPLWVANYGVSCPSMPTGWTQWKFWQKSSTGRVGGISGNVDMDVWNGTLAQLRAYAGVATTTPDAGAPRPDAGAPRPDAGAPRPDAGVSVDGGAIARDGGAGDGGALHDGGLGHDGGTLADAGLETDGGALADAGAAHDGGTPHDAGAAHDGGLDAGGTMGSGGGSASGDACRGGTP